MQNLVGKKCENPHWHSTLFDTAKSANVILLLEAVEVLQAVVKMDNKYILAFDYSSIDVHTLFTKEPFMRDPWFAEQWLVCLSACLAYCARRFPDSVEFGLKYNWLQTHGSKSGASSLVNAVVLISSGQALRTPGLSDRNRLEKPMVWDVKQMHLLLCNLSFVN
jgi:hypothetical protein